MHVLKEECHSAPEQKPDDGHEPSRTCESIENEPISIGPKPNLVKRSPEEGTKRETGHLSYDEVRRESCSATDSNNPWVRTVLLPVHEEGERDARDHSPDEDQVEEICLVCEGVTEAPDDGHGAAEVDWDFVTS